MISNKAPSMNEGAFTVFTMQRKSNDATENSNSGRTFQLWQNFYQFSHTELLMSKSLVWLNFHLARLGRVKGRQPLTRVAGSSAPRQVEGSCHRGEQLASCWGKAPAGPGPGRCMGLDQPLLPPCRSRAPRFSVAKPYGVII